MTYDTFPEVSKRERRYRDQAIGMLDQEWSIIQAARSKPESGGRWVNRLLPVVYITRFCPSLLSSLAASLDRTVPRLRRRWWGLYERWVRVMHNATVYTQQQNFLIPCWSAKKWWFISLRIILLIKKQFVACLTHVSDIHNDISSWWKRKASVIIICANISDGYCYKKNYKKSSYKKKRKDSYTQS